MKRNIFLGALVLSVGLSGQSFGAGLLDRILGHGGRGCCDTAPSCGCEAAPSCGCEAAPSCGCEAAPSCGCEAAPSCGCAVVAAAVAFWASSRSAVAIAAHS